MKTNKTGITIRSYKNNIKYIAKIYFNKKTHYLGSFDTLDDAVNARLAKQKELKIVKIKKEIVENNSQEWRTSREYRIWQAQCIRRDKVCAICGSRKKRNVHHMKNGNDHPKYRFDINNGITLCRDCHTAFHCSYKKSFREKCTEVDWLNFIELLQYIKDIDIKI